MGVSGVGDGRIQDAHKRVMQAEKDANQQIVQTQKRVEDATKEAASRLDMIRDQYVRQADTLRDNHELSAARTKEQGYQNLQELRQTIKTEINTATRQGDKDLRTITDYYGSESQRQLHEGEKNLKAARENQIKAQEYQFHQADEQSQMTKKSQEHQIEDTRQLHESRMNELYSTSQKDYEKTKSAHITAKEKAKGVFDKNLVESLNAHQLTLDRVNRDATGKLKQLTDSYSRSLAAYEDRQTDPFYQMVRLNGEVREATDGFIFVARVPKHEQSQITVNVVGERLLVGGARQAKEKLEESPGHQIETLSFQSFHETYPLSGPIDEKNISKEFDGDHLIVTLPKAKFPKEPTYKKPSADHTRAPRPDFPKGVEAVLAPRGKTEPNDAGDGTLA